MTPYEILVEVLDRLRFEAPTEYKSYYPPVDDIDKLNSARSKAFLHLFLKVKFGLLSFAEREEFITEGTNDGGIDAYHIDSERKTIHFLQSKFRTNERNFEAKVIDPEELLLMDISRILDGETAYENGQEYNPKVLRMAKRIREIKDIGRYTYSVVILANARGITRRKLFLLTGGLPAELIDYKLCYAKLIFPLITGTYYHADQLQLSLSLSNKSAGAKISYTVTTEFTNCEITVVFVPTIEIAKVMFKYRNSILQYNPRSYLGHEGKNVNAEIRRSIENRTTNEFALFNNGITILSDETYLNEKIGQKDRAQLVLTNPQIINGGQTAYTLSMIYRENIDKDVVQVFGEKEVLVKIITFQSATELSDDKKVSLIEDISRATNQQTTVTLADRRSNERSVKDLQDRLFDRTGLFMERKRGEFEEGLREGYIRASEIIERTQFFRAALTAQGKFVDARKRRLVAKMDYTLLVDVSNDTLDRFAFAVLLLNKLVHRRQDRQERITPHLLMRVYFGLSRGFTPGLTIKERDARINEVCRTLYQDWENFKGLVGEPLSNVRLRVGKFEHNAEAYFNSADFKRDLDRFLKEPPGTVEPEMSPQ